MLLAQSIAMNLKRCHLHVGLGNIKHPELKSPLVLPLLPPRKLRLAPIPSHYHSSNGKLKVTQSWSPGWDPSENCLIKPSKCLGDF
uniref:Uncharacterized protein n=1 Tax=Sphaerodactylus townsendi TaxID=933632 RepID=A0ACB8G6C5_9SAUR